MTEIVPVYGIDETSIRNSLFKATTGIFNLARAGVKTILGNEDRSVIVQIVDELVNGKSTSLTEAYGYYDPSTAEATTRSTSTCRRTRRARIRRVLSCTEARTSFPRSR